MDIFGGEKDLEGHTIRCVGEPDVRFHEDGLRILRALRFAARFQFDIEEKTSNSIRRNRNLLDNISVERVFKELQGILVARGAAGILAAFPEVVESFLPETRATFDSKVWKIKVFRIGAAPEESFPMRLAFLLHGLTPQQVKNTLVRLKSDNRTMRYVTTLLEELPKPLPITRGEMRKLIGRIGEGMVRALLCATRILEGTKAVRASEQLMDETLATPPAYTLQDLAIDGQKLTNLGVPAGPLLGTTLKRLLDEVQEEKISNEAEILEERVKELIRSLGA